MRLAVLALLALLLLSVGALGALSTGVIANYRFNNNFNNTLTGYTTTNGGGVLNATVKKVGNGSVEMRAATDYFTIPKTIVVGRTTWSMTGWVYRTTSGVKIFMSNRDGTGRAFELSYDSDGYAGYDLSMTTVTAGVTYNLCLHTAVGFSVTKEWQFLGLAYDGATLNCYFHNQSSGKLVKFTDAAPGGAVSDVGAQLLHGDTPYVTNDRMLLDEFTWWNRTLSDAEVQSVFSNNSNNISYPYVTAAPRVVTNISIVPYTPNTRINSALNATQFVFWVNGSKNVRNCSVYSNASGVWGVGLVRSNPAGLVSAFSFDGGVNASFGRKTGLLHNISFGAGLLGSAARFNLTSWIDYGLFDGNVSKMHNYTVSVWVKPYGTGSSIVWANSPASNDRNGLYLSGGNLVRFGYYNGTAYASKSGDSALTRGVWSHLVARHVSSGAAKGGSVRLWINGVEQSGTTAPVLVYVQKFLVGAVSSTTKFNGSIDELYVFGSAVSDASVQGLYHNYSSVFGVPLRQNISSVASFVTPVDGSYKWGVKCYNSAGESVWSANTTFVLDRTSPVGSLGANNFFGATGRRLVGASVAGAARLNLSATDNLGLYAYEVWVYNGSGVLLNYTNTSVSGTAYRFSKVQNLSAWGDGKYKVNVTWWDSHTAQVISEWDVVRSRDTLDFGGLSVEAVGAVSADAVKQPDRYGFGFVYGDVKAEREYVVESEGELTYLPNSPFKAHFVDWAGKRWVDFDGEGGVIVTKLAKNRYSVRVGVDKVVGEEQVVGFNSVGGLNLVRNSYDFELLLTPPSLVWVRPAGVWGVINSSNGYGSVVGVVGSRQNRTTFSLYNGSVKVGDYVVSYLGNGSHNYSQAFSGLIGSQYWLNVTHTDAAGNSAKLARKMIGKPVVRVCVAGDNVTLNFVVHDEDLLLPILNWSVGFEVEGSYYQESYSSSFSANLSGGHNYSLCLSPRFATPTLSAYVKYAAPNSFTHRYYLVGLNVSNATQYFTLYNFNQTTGKSLLKLTLRDRNTYSFVSGLYVKWQRYYVAESVWRTVQMDKSGDFGLTIFHVKEQTTDYRFLVYDALGRLIKTSDSIKVVCDSLGVCDVETVVVPYASGGSVVSLEYSVSYDNATRMIRADWSDLGGNVQSLRWSVEKQTMRGSTVLCAQTQTGAGGTLLCNVTGVEGTVAVRLYRTASPESAFFTKLYDLAGLKLSDKIGDRNGALILGAMLVTGAGFGVVSPVIGVVVTVFMVFVGAGLGLMGALTTTIVLTVGIMGVVVGLLLRK